MARMQKVSLRALGKNRAGEMRLGRFLRNPKVTVKELMEGVCAGIGERAEGRHVLAIQDTSELNFQAHAERVKGLGTVGNGEDVGFFIHPTLVVDAEEGSCLGLGDVRVWHRSAKKKSTSRRPTEEKESFRWIEAAQACHERLKERVSQMTVVADRDADMYELLERLPRQGCEVLVRAAHDRCVDMEDGEKLFAWLAAQPRAHSYAFELPAIPGKRAARQARMELRWGRVTLKRPHNCSDRTAAQRISVTAIEVREVGSCPNGEKPVHWRLLTTHDVPSVQKAMQCVSWYRQRWHIEQLFRTLKKQGLDVESSLLEEGERLQKLAVLALSAATRCMQLTLAREGTSSRPARDVFTPEEQRMLHRVNPTLEGKTLLQKNPHPRNSLAWAAWIIARLGGWKGYASERKPGPITMLRGLNIFTQMHQGSLLTSTGRDVCIR